MANEAVKRPMLWVACLYGSGVIIAEYRALPVLPLWITTLTLILAACFGGKIRLFSLVLSLMFAGALGLTLSKAILGPTDLRKLLPKKAELVSVRGKLPETPLTREYDNGTKKSWRSTTQLEVSAVKVGKAAWHDASGTVVVSTSGQLPDIFGGQVVEIDGVSDLPKAAIAEGLFDYRAYLARQGIYYHVEVSSAKDWRIVVSPANRPLADRFRDWACTAFAIGLPEKDQTLKLEWALTLGIRHGLTDDVWEPFIQAATFHIFAVDGLRMAIVFGILFQVLRFSRLPRPIAGAILVPLIWAYVALTGWPPSAIRATVMLTLVIFGWVLRRPLDLYNSLFAAAFLILVWQPQQMFQAGFQLSFCVVLCIIVLMPRLEKLHERLPGIKPEPLLPPELQRKWHPVIRIPVKFCWGTLLVSFAAWIGSLPLSAYYFNILSHVSTPANLLAVPLCALVLIANLTSLLFAAWLPAVASIFNHAGWALMKCIEMSSAWFIQSPKTYLYLETPSVFSCFVFYVLLLALATGWLFAAQRRVYNVAALSVLLVVWGVVSFGARKHERLTVLPLSGSSAVFWQGTKRGHSMLINCGSEFAAGFTLKPFLRAQGVNQLENLVLTQGDVRLCGGAPLLDGLFRIKHAWAGEHSARSPAYKQALALFTDGSNRLSLIGAGAKIGDIEVLYPKSDSTFTRAQDNAIVLAGTINNRRLLYLSELGVSGQQALLEHPERLKADIVIAGVADKVEPLRPELLSAIHPKLIILADSEQPVTHRASDKLIARLEAFGTPVLTLHKEGAITLETAKNGLTVRTMSGRSLSARDLDFPPRSPTQLASETADAKEVAKP